MRTIRASEIGAYLYCQRAWWYQKSGVPSDNQADLAAGADLHYRHGRAVLRLSLIRVAAYGLLLLALVLIAVYFTSQAL
jgi:CRISPR/Cas system-associated exonuclease Cas4 (RecB family)